jgi:hypothetical protein
MPDEQSRMTRAILLAGLLGGLLGGVASFAASRVITPAPTARSETAPAAASEARPIAEGFMERVVAGKEDELAEAARRGVWLVTDQEYATFRGQFTADRARFAREFGPPAGQFEFVRESILSESLVHVVYLEKFQRDGVLWYFVLYRTADGWKLVGVSWKDKLGVVAGTLD